MTEKQINTAFSREAPELQLIWDSTSIGLFKTCKRKYFYKMIEHWAPKTQALPLSFGIAYHEAMELYDRQRADGVSHDEAVYNATALALKYSPQGEPDSYRNRETLTRSVIWYLEHFKEDPAQTLTLANGKAAVEVTFKLELPIPSHTGEAMFISGHMDRLVELSGDMYVMDYKTTKAQLTPNYFADYSPNNQVSLYTFASKIVMAREARGVIINGIQLGVNFTRFARQHINRTDGQLDEWYKETLELLEEAGRCVETGRWPMNDMACSMYGGCEFRKVCSQTPSMRERVLRTDFERKMWDPAVDRGA